MATYSDYMENSTQDHSKITAWQRRQEDTGWGRVLLQAWLPFYWIYYAVSRRTITPWLHGIGFSFAAALLVGALLDATKPDTREVDQNAEPLSSLAALVVAPFGFKIGTDSARQFAKQKLDET
jgi:hypothetical protein